LYAVTVWVVGLLQLRKVLLQLVVAQQSVVVIGRVIDDPAAELRRSGTDAEKGHKQDGQYFRSHGLLPFFPQRFEGMVWFA